MSCPFKSTLNPEATVPEAFQAPDTLSRSSLERGGKSSSSDGVTFLDFSCSLIMASITPCFSAFFFCRRSKVLVSETSTTSSFFGVLF